VTRAVHNPGQWPRLMRAETAAAYVDEVSVQAFRRKVGTTYPRPVSGKGERQKWDKLDLDQAATARGTTTDTPAFDAASVL
jgi:hypothetical protein